MVCLPGVSLPQLAGCLAEGPSTGFAAISSPCAVFQPKTAVFYDIAMVWSSIHRTLGIGAGVALESRSHPTLSRVPIVFGTPQGIRGSPPAIGYPSERASIASLATSASLSVSCGTISPVSQPLFAW